MTGLRDRYTKRNQQVDDNYYPPDYNQEEEEKQDYDEYEEHQEGNEYVEQQPYQEREHQDIQQQEIADPYRQALQRRIAQQNKVYQRQLEPEPETPYSEYDNGYYPHRDDEGPLSILEEIKIAPSPKGTFPVMIGGRPIDLHALEDYVVKISPHALSTLLRYRNARTIEEIKGYGKFGAGMKLKGGTLLLLLLAVGGGVLGIIMIMFLPEIMAFFQGGM